MSTKLVAVSVLSLVLVGCAGSADYARYVDSQAQMQIAKSNADAERYRAMAVIAQSGDSTAKVAAMFAMQSSGFNQVQTSQILPPKNGWDIAREWTGLVLPAAVQAYGINANKHIAVTQSNNSRDVAVSTNEAFVGMASQIQAPQPNVTIGGNGVVGDGTMTTSTTTSTVDNHTVNPVTQIPPGSVCVVTSTGSLSCN